VDGADRGIDVRGVVSDDASSAVFTITQVETTIAYPAGRVRLPGLDPSRTYRLHVLAHGPEGDAAGQSVLEWTQHPIVLTGRQLAATGIRPPVQLPQQSTVLELVAEP
jgi:alpha-galactosidase